MLDFFESDIMEKENGLLYRYSLLKNQTRARCIRSIWNRLGYLAEIEIIFESACTLVKYLHTFACVTSLAERVRCTMTWSAHQYQMDPVSKKVRN